MRTIFLLITFLTFAAAGLNGVFAANWDSDHPKYREALEKAKTQNKPLLILFTGYSCKNNNATQEILKSAGVRKILTESYVFLELYVDDRTSLYAGEMYISESFGAQVTTEGMRNADLEISKFNNNSQPYFVVVDQNEKVITQSSFLATEEDFVSFLRQGIEP